MPDQDEIPRERRVEAVMLFFASVGPREAAEYAVGLQEAVDGLSRNNTALTMAILERKDSACPATSRSA